MSKPSAQWIPSDAHASVSIELTRIVSLFAAMRAPEAEAAFKTLLSDYPALMRFGFFDPILRRRGDWTLRHSVEHIHYFWTHHVDHAGFILSYPKCGRTWLRLMMTVAIATQSGLKTCDPLNLSEISRAHGPIPVTVSHDDYPHWNRLDDIQADKEHFATKKVLFMVRDPRDVLISSYFECTKRTGLKHAGVRFDGSPGDWIGFDIGGLRNIVRFYNVWATAADIPAAFMRLSYEDLIADPANRLCDALAFFGMPGFDPRVAAAIAEAFSFDSMRALEAGDGLQHPALRPGDGLQHAALRPGDPADPESFKTRRGVVGGYTDYLSRAEIDRIDRIIDATLSDAYAVYKCSAPPALDC